MLLAYGGSSIDGGLYRAVNSLAERSPAWLDSAVSFFSTYGLALFAALMAAAWWRARAAAARSRTAMALAAPVVVVVAFLTDDALKSVTREHRPCQTLHTVTLEACPPPSDWSFPSNHAAIAAAAAVAVLFIDRKLAAIAVPAAILMACSRVWVGAHYPHDAAMGLLVGGAVAWLLMTQARRAAPLVERLRKTRLRPLVAPR